MLSLTLMHRLPFLLLMGMVCVLLSGCLSNAKPSNASNLCSIFSEKPHWYKAAKRSSEKWGGPIHVPMAIIYQESSFKSDARPPMQYFLGIIPRGRASDAYGYSQALKSTWAEYEKEVGSWGKDRDDFSSAFDFVQWYMNKSYQRNGVSKWDAYAQYLNYHEGQGGYSRGSHLKKKWLLATAVKVGARSKQYSTQLGQCQAELNKRKRRWF